MLVNGTLQPGEKLPSIREMARKLKINPTTVTRIYNELEHEGILVLRQGQGAFVAEPPVPKVTQEVKAQIRKYAQTLLVEGLRVGLSFPEICEILDDEYKNIQQRETCRNM